MIKAWKNYVSNYNKFQWWLSGLIYGLYIGSWYKSVTAIRAIWNEFTVEPLTFTDAVRLHFDLKFVMTPSEEYIRIWLLDEGYNLKADAWPEGTFPTHVTHVSH